MLEGAGPVKSDPRRRYRNIFTDQQLGDIDNPGGNRRCPCEVRIIRLKVFG